MANVNNARVHFSLSYCVLPISLPFDQETLIEKYINVAIIHLLNNSSSKYTISTIMSKNNETFLILNIFFIWRNLYSYNSIFYDLSPPPPFTMLRTSYSAKNVVWYGGNNIVSGEKGKRI